VTYNQVVVLKPRRISLPPQVLPDRHVTVTVIFGKHAHSARIETQDVEQHTPHADVEDASELTKHAAQAVASPLERPAVARDAERHLGLDHLDDPSPPAQVEEPEKVGVRRRIEDDLRGGGTRAVRTTIARQSRWRRETRTKPLNIEKE
jgi:hypothetical protein